MGLGNENGRSEKQQKKHCSLLFKAKKFCLVTVTNSSRGFSAF